MGTSTRTKRSRDEKIAEIDSKILSHQKNIAALEIKKANILNPSSRKTRLSVKSVFEKAKEAGMTPEQIAEKLGITLG